MDYLEEFRHLVERSPAFRGKSVDLVLIANPVAGGFTIRRRAEENRETFSTVLDWVKHNPVLTTSCSARLHLTDRAGHAREITEIVLDEMVSGYYRSDCVLIVTAGGDGTSHEVQTAIATRMLEAGHMELRERLCVLRLPFGTGNDGSDGRHLSEALELLTSEVDISFNRVVCVKRTGDKPLKYAFNIASVGIDAFVSDMTNRLKTRLPGDVYKLWIDLACVFYNKIYRVGEMDLATSLNGTKVWSERAKWVLAVMGASGKRTYGSNQKILPGIENVCSVKEMPFISKLLIKERLKQGTHVNSPLASLCNADRLVIGYDRPVLMQLDGETVPLTAADFPVVMELTEACIPTLRPKT